LLGAGAGSFPHNLKGINADVCGCPPHMINSNPFANFVSWREHLSYADNNGGYVEKVVNGVVA
jgi:hypothetical protein